MALLKLSKKAWLLLTSGIFIILAAGLGMAYSQQGDEQGRLNEELALARLRLENYPAQQLELTSQQKKLESRLAMARSQLKNTRAGLSRSTESIEASGGLFEIAGDCHVEVTEISSPGPTTRELEGVTLAVLPLTVTVEGEVLDLIDFVSRWTGDYATGVVESVEISVPLPPGEEEEEEEGEVEETEETEGAEEEEAVIKEQEPSAVINLLIYSYEGD